MAQIVKLRRSSVSGQKPTNSNLQLGELALNTTDGKVYMAKSGSLGPSVEELITTNTVNTGSIFITGNVTASNFSGSFKGDGSQLYNIPSSGVTGLELNKIVNGSATASISQTDGLRINTKTEITGSVIITQDLTVSGSMTLGSGLDSYLMFKGVISSSLAPDSDGDTHYIGGPNRRWAGVYGTTGSFTRLSNFNTPSSSIIIERASVSGSFTGSYIGDGTGLYNIPFQISGSDILGNQSNKTFTKLHFDSDTGLNVSESAPGTAFVSIGSHFKDIFVYGQPLLRATGSDSFEIIGQDGIGITTSITDTNSNGYIKELKINATSLSSSLNNRIDVITGSIDGLNNFTSSVVLTSQTGSMTVLSASYAVTAAFALNAGAGGGGGSAIGSYSSLEVTSAASTWSFAHNSGQQYPIFQVFDSNGLVVIPSQIRAIDEDLAEIIFPSPQTGRVIASLGGGNGTTQEFINSNLWTVNHNLGTDYPDVTIWDSNRNIIFPNRIESVNTNQIKVYFSVPVSGHVSVSRGGHLLSGSVNTIEGLVSGSSQITYSGLTGIPNGIVSGSEQLTGSYDTRYVLSGSITQTTWDNIANKPSGLISGSIQVDLTGTTGYSTFSSSVATITSGLTSTITSLSSSLSSSIDNLSSSVASINNTQNGRLDSLETASGSIRSDFNSFTSSYTTVSSSLDSRLDVLETYSGSQQVPTASFAFRAQRTDVYCKNMSGTQINKGTVVRIVGSVGDNPLIGVASFLTEGQSANTLGIAAENIPNDSFGSVITEGVLLGVNTTGMTAGQLIFLGANGTFTTSYPVAPNHGVRLGEVLREQQNNGSIYVRVDNGAELGESHDVYDTTTNSSYGDLLVKSGSVWVNSRSLNGDYAVTGSLTITQNLTVLGSSSLVYVTSSNLAVSASFISVNVFEPAERFGGLKVYDSGSSNATASLAWDSLHNHWVYQNASGSSYSGGMLLSGPRNSGSLGDEPNLINGRIVKSVGGDHIDVSIISETGTTITVAGDLVANSITGAFDFYGLVNRPTLVSGSSQIDITGTTGYSTFSGSVSSSIGLLSSSIATTDFNQDGRLVNLETSTGSLNSFTSSINTTIKSKLDSDGVISGSSQIIYSGLTGTPSGIVSGSSQIIYSGLTGIPSDIVSGSSQLTGSYDTRYVLSGSITQTTWDNIANKPNDIVSSSTQIGAFGFLETSSFNTYTSSNDGRVSSLESKTGSYATTGSNSFIGTERVTGSLIVSSSLNVIGTQNVTGSLIVSNSLNVIGTQNINGNLSVTGSVVISGSLDISSANVGSSRFLFTQTTGSTTWNITHNLNYNYPNVTVYDGSTNKVMLPADVTSIDVNTIQVTFATPEYGYALVSVGGITTATADRFLFTATSATGSWVIDHNMGYKYVNIDVYDNNDEQLIPQKVTAVSVNRTQVDFSLPTSGNAIITLGGPRSAAIFNQTGSFYNTTTNIGITGSLVVTGDVDANNFNTTSDKKLKIDLIRIEGALDKIEKLNGYTFNWLEEYSEDRTRQIGLIADEVYEVQPELISNRSILLGGKEEEIKLLDYSKVTALLLEGIKELTKRVTKLENKKKKK
jgi:hypothetical protein